MMCCLKYVVKAGQGAATLSIYCFPNLRSNYILYGECIMPRGGNGGGGGKPDNGGGGSGSAGTSWKGSRNDDWLRIVEDGEVSGSDEVSTTDFLTGEFNASRGHDKLDFSALTTGITLRYTGNRDTGQINFDQGNHGFFNNFWEVATSGLASIYAINFEEIIGTSGDDNIYAGSNELTLLDGGAGDDRLQLLIAAPGAVTVGGTGSDHLIGYSGHIYVGGEWDGTYGPQSGDGETDFFESTGVILDFEVPSGTFDGDQLVVSGVIGPDNPDAVEQILALEFVAGTWTDPEGNTHDAAVFPTIDGTGALFTLVGVDVDDANALVLPEIRVSVAAGDATLITGSGNDDFFESYGAFGQILFELDGGNDTLAYPDYADSFGDTLYFEGEVPTNWSFEMVNGVESWTANYNSQTITILGLDQNAFDSLTMLSVDPGSLG